MAAVWIPPYWLEHWNRKYSWRLRFAWIPCRNSETGEIMWLKRYYYGWRIVDGPAGERPVKLELRLTGAQYTWFQLTNA